MGERIYRQCMGVRTCIYVQAVRGSTVQGGSTYRQYRRCVGVRRYHANLPYMPCSPCSTVVRGGSVGFNHPELMRNFPTGLAPSVIH